METSEDGWVNNECGDFMWDEALKSSESKVPTVTKDDKIESTTEMQPALIPEKKIVL